MSDIVRLLERAEEGCEGLKHGYYNLPCVHFLIFLCHDIKNKIDRLFLFLRTTAFGLFLKILQNYFSLSNKNNLENLEKSCYNLKEQNYQNFTKLLVKEKNLV